jgi:CheY-like chemotaxis protein
MNPILVVDDDEDDLEMIKIVWTQLDMSRPIFFFKNGNELIDYIKRSNQGPFLILCDLHLPGETGFDIKKRVAEDPDLKYKSVPFIFWSTDASEKQIQYAYDLPVQGFFFKPTNLNDLRSAFTTIMDYWQKSQHPKQVQ